MSMTIELQMLMFSALLGLLQLCLASAASTAQRGLKWNLSSRDEAKLPLTGLAGRLDRAAANFKETFPIFMAATVVVLLMMKNSPHTALGAQIYFYSRVLYVPLYAFGIRGVRTLVWLVSIAGILMVLLGAL